MGPERDVLGKICADPFGILLLQFGHDNDFVAHLGAKRSMVFQCAMMEGVPKRGMYISGDVILIPDILQMVLQKKKHYD
jgi:hypothetical protein